MTEPARRRGPLALAALLLAGCASTVPLQTASTVPKGVVRLSGQLTSSPWCSVSSDLKNCAYAPGNNSAALPELRLDGRVGVHERVDVGLSAFANYVFSSGVRWGAQAGGKVELLHLERHVLSVGLGVGLTRLEDTRSYKTADASYLQLDAVLPVRYGYQFESLELFAGPHFIERVSFDPPGLKGPAEVPWFGLSVGLMTRGRAKLGVGLGYESPLRYFDAGAFDITVAFLYDLGGRGDDRDADVSPSQVPTAVDTGSQD